MRFYMYIAITRVIRLIYNSNNYIVLLLIRYCFGCFRLVSGDGQIVVISCGFVTSGWTEA